MALFLSGPAELVTLAFLLLLPLAFGVMSVAPDSGVTEDVVGGLRGLFLAGVAFTDTAATMGGGTGGETEYMKLKRAEVTEFRTLVRRFWRAGVMVGWGETEGREAGGEGEGWAKVERHEERGAKRRVRGGERSEGERS